MLFLEDLKKDVISRDEVFIIIIFAFAKAYANMKIILKNANIIFI